VRGACVIALWGLAGGAQALELQLPQNAVLTREVVTAVGHVDLPTGPTVEGWLPSEAREGQVTEQAWRIEAAALTTLQILAPLRQQLAAQGFEVLFDCETDSCGGFDFRRAVAVLPPPEMFVNLGDFRWLTAVSGEEAVTVMVSRSPVAGFVQVTRVGPPQAGGTLGAAEAPALAGVPVAETTPVTGELGARLEADGRVVLSDLAFETGSAALSDGNFVSLEALAAYLAANPERRVALVGHTDAEGSLEANIALSKRRAGSVLERLVEAHGAARGQMQAEGMGWLAPLATNLTVEGREANRRVEVILLSTE
jgi:outer membrane protein OmpA-like peptidoglycan-associated protein